MWLPGPILGCLAPFLGFQDQFWGARTHLRVPIPIMGCLDLSQVPGPILGCLGLCRGARTHLGVPGFVLGCQGPSWVSVPMCPGSFLHVWICFGVPGPILGCQYLFDVLRVPPGASGLFQGCQDLFWDSNPCFGVPGSHFGCPDQF